MSIKTAKHLVLILSLILSGLILIPVFLSQLKGKDQRRLYGKRLNEVNFTEIKFKNEAQDLSLAGLLFSPHGEGPFPAVVMIHGSGTSQRDNPWYLTLADYLQKNGILVLLPDKRGSGASEGDWRSSDFEDLASDAIAAVDYLKSQNKYPISKIGVIGLSQGGQIAPVAASQCPEIKFIINVVGAAVPMHEQFLFEEKNNLSEIGFLPAISSLLAKLTTWYHIHLGSNKEFWETIGNFDSMDYWQKIKVDVFVLYGGNDPNTPSHESAERLRALNKKNIRVRIYEDSGHALEDPEYEGNSIFRKDALEDIKEFIHAQ